jgi:stage II sporulation protein D
MKQTFCGLFLFLVILVLLLPLILIKCDTKPKGIIVRLYLKNENKIIPLELEEYIKGVVAAEMPAKFHLEALKAQAIAARTVTVKRLKHFGGPGYQAVQGADLSDDVNDSQAWLGKADLLKKWGLFNYYTYWRKISRAVEETSGLIITYEGKPVDAVYHSTSGPKTENSEEVWGVFQPYLRSVQCPFDKHSPRYFEEKTFPLLELQSRLGLDTYSPSSGDSFIRIINYTASGRVKNIKIGGRVYQGKELRSLLGLNSTFFTCQISDQKVVFKTIGYGHGVGLCQYGADGLAELGKDYKEIIHYYYQGVEIRKLSLK